MQELYTSEDGPGAAGGRVGDAWKARAATPDTGQGLGPGQGTCKADMQKQICKLMRERIKQRSDIPLRLMRRIFTQLTNRCGGIARQKAAHLCEASAKKHG